ncbi:CaiB/BaiF CoA transferase family protein [Pseudonocardia parietis]|uniref:Crotonobetainyl-CoA:carnitine CoA-transferase CaiB-like acyl-CoA transferase n=1 Tax=Pseudonocardia parietis TaxID=570936 RepID=A0ABS4VV16_9PSEU|nr:CoA transferase [Pseudonocardia parietis]MBP2367759.1 crotonobetainyl-CoA:carnitine CoA-transferase CaiB-like acyl-CoA transferase [Pseudonocardia parietis]
MTTSDRHEHVGGGSGGDSGGAPATPGPGGPLDGITVVDLTSTFMGPFCTLILAQFGARVIKIEPPGGDILRGVGDTGGHGLGPIFLNANLGKESVVLDLRDDADHRRLLRLIEDADVVAHNRPAGSDERLGIDYETLRTINPAVIVCAMRGYGAGGPYGSEPAYDDVIQAVSGLAANQTGRGEPQFVRSPVSDKVTGMLAMGAICAALVERARSGRGQAIEVPMFETMAQFLLVEQQGGYVFDPPRGDTGYARTDSPFRRPYRTRDGLVGVLPYTDAHWRTLFEVLDAGDRADDPRFATIGARSRHIDELYEWLDGELATRTTAETVELFRRAKVPIMPVNGIADLFTDPHLDAVDFFRSTEHPQLGTVRHARSPVRFSRSGSGPFAQAPALDSHGRELRAELDDRSAPPSPTGAAYSEEQ